jgi:hypothetical protein
LRREQEKKIAKESFEKREEDGKKIESKIAGVKGYKEKRSAKARRRIR